MTSLAVVWTRPETVCDDIARVLAMSDFTAMPGEALAVIRTAAATRRGPGISTAPWQTAGVLATVSPHGGEAPSQRITARTRIALHLPVARLDSKLGVGCCLEALAAVAGPSGRRDRGADARSVVNGVRRALASDVGHWFLVDATLVPGSHRPASALQSCNLLLAGRDPVALDAAVARVLGFDPFSLPLLSLAADAGLGDICPDPSAMVGDVAELQRRPLVAWRPATSGGVARLVRRASRVLGGRFERDVAIDTPWHALWREDQGTPIAHREES